MSNPSRSLLLDTHALLWWVTDDARLSATAREAIADTPRVFASEVSLWEMAVKCSIGKLALDRSAQEWFTEHVARSRFAPLPINADHLGAVELLPLHHRDQFDRLLVCQAQHERVPIVTADPGIAAYDLGTVW